MSLHFGFIPLSWELLNFKHIGIKVWTRYFSFGPFKLIMRSIEEMKSFSITFRFCWAKYNLKDIRTMLGSRVS